MGWGAGGSCTPRPPIRQQPVREPRVIAVVFLGLLLDLLAFTLLLPLLPGLLESHGRAHDPLYGSWQRGVDWFAAAIRMPAEKRSDRLGLLLPAVPLGTSHGGGLGLSREAPSDVAVPGRSGHLVCRVGGLEELRSLPGLQGDRGHQQGERQPLHRHRCRPGLSFRPQQRHGSHRSGLLAGLHAGPHAWRLLACGHGALARFALCCLRPVVYFLLPAGDAAPGEAGTLHRPGVPGRRRPAQPRGPAPFFSRGPWPGPTCWRRARSPSPPGPGLLPLPLPVLGPGVHPELPRSPALPVQQPAAGKDVLLHRPHHGHRAGRLRPKDQPRRGDCSGEAGHLAAGARLPPHRLGAHAARARPGAAALLLRCRRRGALPVLCGRGLRLARAEGHHHGHAAEPRRPGQGGGTLGGCLSVLAGGGQGLLHRVLRPLPAPLPAAAQPEASSPRGAQGQGRVAEPAPSQAGGPLPSPWGPAPAPARHSSPSAAGAWPGLPATWEQGLQNLPGFLFALLRDTVSANPPNDKIKQLLYTKRLPPAHGCASPPPPPPPPPPRSPPVSAGRSQARPGPWPLCTTGRTERAMQGPPRAAPCTPAAGRGGSPAPSRLPVCWDRRARLVPPGRAVLGASPVQSDSVLSRSKPLGSLPGTQDRLLEVLS
ncbi:major facilitator superfamily domain-containing protein 10 isoform X2 [Hyaena hyaena]|nr:major facilitator superfamily domain-containing protein 10 isoform X2 [Hyaena hyaena]XP_039088000.1 major facilitator superfamily domain-containing protein 10 isoform X2 [Hyaena hyaena]